MKKTFPLTSERHKPARVIEKIHGEARKYIKRERNKKLPEGTDFWDFDCRVGVTAEDAQPVHVAELSKAITTAGTGDDVSSIYLEILAKPGIRTKKPPPEL